MIVRVNYMMSMYPMVIEADSVEEALDIYWNEVEVDESYEIIEDEPQTDCDKKCVQTEVGCEQVDCAWQ